MADAAIGAIGVIGAIEVIGAIGVGKVYALRAK
jgi:hypothetical protein